MNIDFKYKLLENKYLIITGLFIIWMFFFDTNSIITHFQLNKDLKKIKQEKITLKKEINKEKKEYNILIKHPSEIERIARELYNFKKSNEDLFIIETKKIEE